MEPIVLRDIPFEIESEALLARLRIPADGPHASEVLQLAAEAQALAGPKAMYTLAYIEERGEDDVRVDSVRLHSRVLRVNTAGANRLFAQVATCGRELHEWSESLDDMLQRYWADAIKALALQAASRALSEDLEQRFRPGKTARMAPGSLADWPIREQRPLFNLLGDVEATIGVHLTDSYLMVPNKSTSGVRFPTERTFESCQLCPREGCPGRRAVYDPELYQKEYAT